jgi:hypothetical protein
MQLDVGVCRCCNSSYMLYRAKQLGLRPLAVHFDNTWDSTVAVENIHDVPKNWLPAHFHHWLGLTVVSSDKRDPSPPARMATFIRTNPLNSRWPDFT